MPIPNIDIDEAIKSVTKLVDGSIESEQERQITLTERLRIDNTSPFKLPHLIRPIAFIWAMALQTALSITALFQDGDLLVILGSNSAILMTMVGFYFSSRKAEKINAKKVFAAIEIEKEKAKVEIKKDEAILSENKKQARIDRKEQRRENRKN